MTAAGREIVGETLRILQADLDLRIVPHLENSDALLAAKMISDLLAYLAMWHLEFPERIAEHTAAKSALVADRGAGESDFASELPVEGADYGRLADALQREIEEGVSSLKV